MLPVLWWGQQPKDYLLESRASWYGIVIDAVEVYLPFDFLIFTLSIISQTFTKFAREIFGFVLL